MCVRVYTATLIAGFHNVVDQVYLGTAKTEQLLWRLNILLLFLSISHTSAQRRNEQINKSVNKWVNVDTGVVSLCIDPTLTRQYDAGHNRLRTHASAGVQCPHPNPVLEGIIS